MCICIHGHMNIYTKTSKKKRNKLFYCFKAEVYILTLVSLIRKQKIGLSVKLT